MPGLCLSGRIPRPLLYDTLESTNRTAKLLALEGTAHGTLVLAGGQTAGRGRLGRSFASPAGKGVYCSVVLRPPLPAANAQTATIGAAVAVCRAVQTLTLWRAGTLEQILHTGQQLNTWLPQTTQQTEPELLGKPVNDKAPQPSTAPLGKPIEDKKQLTEKLSDALDALLHRSADTTEK